MYEIYYFSIQYLREKVKKNLKSNQNVKLKMVAVLNVQKIFCKIIICLNIT